MPCGARWSGRSGGGGTPLMSGLAGDSERVGDLGPRGAPVQGAGDEPCEVDLGGSDVFDLRLDSVEGLDLESLVTLHGCQDALTRCPLSGHPDSGHGRGSTADDDQSRLEASLRRLDQHTTGRQPPGLR
jgi:hypothetical protein